MSLVTYYLFDNDNKVLYSTACASYRELIEKALQDKISFRNAYLRQADLTNLDLSECDFTGADLTGCRVRGANLRGTKGFLNNRTAKLVWNKDPFGA